MEQVQINQARVGMYAPNFEAIAIINREFRRVKLSGYQGKYVVLFFYPADFTFVCPTEVAAFSDRDSEFRELNTQILGVSVDSQFCHLAWIETSRSQGGVGDLNYPLISDSTRTICNDYNVLDASTGMALRALFIIDRQGIIQHCTINNLEFGRSTEETLRSLKAIQHIQKNPSQLCPVDWQEGDPTVSAGLKIT
jgi:peroxiredoxin 2/4